MKLCESISGPDVSIGKAKSFVASRFTARETYVGRFVASGWCQCGGFRRYTAGAAFWGFLANPCLGPFSFWFSVSSPFHPKFVQNDVFSFGTFLWLWYPPPTKNTLNPGNFWRGVFCWGFFPEIYDTKLHHESITCRPAGWATSCVLALARAAGGRGGGLFGTTGGAGDVATVARVVGTSTSREGISGVIEH